MKSAFYAVSIFLLAIVLAGCSSSKKTVATQTGTVSPEESDGNQELALQFFLQGSMLDQKTEYANAILEYQEALRHTQDPAVYHAIAKDYAILGKHEQAIQNGREATRRAPSNRTYHETLADIYIAALNLDGALGEYEAIVGLDSLYRNGWLGLARLQQIKNPEKALATYQQVIDRFGPDADAYFQTAQIYNAMGKLDKAVEALTGLLALDPGNFEVSKVLGETYLRQDSTDAALRLYTDLVEQHPEDLELRAAMAHAFLVKQDYDRAAEQFESVMKKDSVSIDDQLRFGQVFLGFVQRDSAVAPYAVQLFEKIKAKHPDDWRPYWFLGAIDNVMKNDSSALKNFEKVKELASWNADGWVGIASIYYDHEQLDKAISVLQEAQKIIPEEFRIYFLLGITYQRKHDLINAASTLERAITLNAKSVDAVSALALVYDELKRPADSDTMYERALTIDPHNHLVLNNYGYSLAERGLQLDRALKMSKEALDLQPTNQSYLDTYGWIQYRFGNYEEAEKYIRKAIELGSTSAVVFEHLGDVYARLDQKEKAREYWQHALELDTSNDALRLKIQRGTL